MEAIFIGKARQHNRRFLLMRSHHLIKSVACTPALAYEKGQVENQVGNLRNQLFRPKPRVASLTELSSWLVDQCIAIPNEPGTEVPRPHNLGGVPE